MYILYMAYSHLIYNICLSCKHIHIIYIYTIDKDGDGTLQKEEVYESVLFIERYRRGHLQFQARNNIEVYITYVYSKCTLYTYMYSV